MATAQTIRLINKAMSGKRPIAFNMTAKTNPIKAEAFIADLKSPLFE